MLPGNNRAGQFLEHGGKNVFLPSMLIHINSIPLQVCIDLIQQVMVIAGLINRNNINPAGCGVTQRMDTVSCSKGDEPGVGAAS